MQQVSSAEPRNVSFNPVPFTKHKPTCLILFVPILICLVFYPLGSMAAETSQDSSLLLELGADDEGGQDSFISIDTLLDQQHLIYFSHGRHTSTETGNLIGLFNASGFSTKLITFGVEDIANTAFNTGFGIEWWGNEDLLTTQTLRALLRYNWSNFSFDVTPQMQRIRFIDLQVADSQRSFDINSDGWSASVSYFSPRNWFVQLRRNENNYHYRESGLGVLLARVQNTLRGRIYAQNYYGRHFDQASVLELFRTSITVGSSIKKLDIALDWSKGQSLIGKTHSENISLSLAHPIAENLSVLGQLGEIRADEEENLSYGSVALSFRW